MTPSDTLSSRSIAFDILQEVVRQRQPFDETMDKHPLLRKLEARDRAFVHLLVATVLRRMGQLDEIIKSCLDKPHELKAKAHDLLRLGAAQLLFLQTPAHAAVDTIVSLAAADNSTAPYKGLINALLRRIDREGHEKLKTQDITKLNIPAWMWLSWRQAYGVARAREVAVACLGEAHVDISVKENAPLWAEKLNAQLLPTGSLRLTDTVALTEREGFAEGAWWVQDAAAALPVLLLGQIEGKTIIDLCAAPGGKTAQLASAGAKVVAVDRAAKRLERLKENMKRLGLTVDVVCKDGADYKPDSLADAVLVDAPCSATGTIRRHPDILRLKYPEDVERLATLQNKLLNHTLQHVLKPGGTLIYSVCSLQKEEGEDQITRLLSERTDFEIVPIKPEEMGGCADFITEEGYIRCLPCQWAESGGIDGFFAARLKKHEN